MSNNPVGEIGLARQPAEQRLSARLSLNGDRIVLTGYSPELTEFYHSLPNARYDSLSHSWLCDFTPAAAWRIVGREEFTQRGMVAEALDKAAWDFHQALLESKSHNPTQPPIHKTTNWTHQCKAFWFAYPLPAVLLAEDMGCGKSLTALDLLANWNCQTVLILCPCSVRAVWRREFERHCALPFEVVILDKGSVVAKTGQAILEMEGARRLGQPVAIVVNYETAWRPAFAAWSLKQEWDCVIADESHRAKAHNSQISKFMAKLGRRAKHRLCLTGTPMSHSPLDLFGQFRFLDPGMFGTSWHHFSNHFAVKGNPSIPQMITGYKNQEELHNRMALLTYQCKAADVLDLPEKQHIELPCELGSAAAKAYKEIEEEMITEIKGGVVTVQNCLTRLLRLQQVTSGFLAPDDSDAVETIDTAKADALADLLDGLDQREPVVVFCRFRHDLKSVQEVAKNLGRRYGELSGSRRDGLTDRAEMSPEIDVLGAQIQSGGVGIDLVRARYAVYFSLGFSLSDYEQSQARLHRPGQTRHVTLYHLVCPGTVDARVYGALAKRKDVIEAVMKGYANEDQD